MRETAEVGGSLYVVGHPSEKGTNAGMAVYRILDGTRCELVAGNVRKDVDWRDGTGTGARFSRPHQMAAFRENELLLTDIDNRAVRRLTIADARVLARVGLRRGRFLDARRGRAFGVAQSVDEKK